MDELRIGDAEREDALRKLGDHLAAGRLDIDEHSERSSRILAARTRGDVRTVFADLPAPHPDLGYPVPASAGDAPPERARRRHRPSRRRSRGSAVRTFAGELTAVIWIVSIVFLVATRVGWWVILVRSPIPRCSPHGARRPGITDADLHRPSRRSSRTRTPELVAGSGQRPQSPPAGFRPTYSSWSGSQGGEPSEPHLSCVGPVSCGGRPSTGTYARTRSTPE
jgi:Domain of unknown function (DUF1707)